MVFSVTVFATFTTAVATVLPIEDKVEAIPLNLLDALSTIPTIGYADLPSKVCKLPSTNSMLLIASVTAVTTLGLTSSGRLLIVLANFSRSPSSLYSVTAVMTISLSASFKPSISPKLLSNFSSLTSISIGGIPPKVSMRTFTESVNFSTLSVACSIGSCSIPTSSSSAYLSRI